MSLPRQTIWRLVRACAEDLTSSGTSPFTRGDLIKCIQRKDPSYAENSINPIIQGVTNNLRGGAPGAVGKNLLHSVGRGLFILAEEQGSTEIPANERQERSVIRQRRPVSTPSANAEKVAIGTYSFVKVCDIQPQTDSTGKLENLQPQRRYNNEQDLPLNNYGAGPFCKFKIPTNLPQAGVYAIFENDRVMYIGECQNLSSRYNMGYGNISPRNCFVGGQETNCRINNLIFVSCKGGKSISLWFHQTDNYKSVESELRATVKLEWNRA